MPSLFRFLVVAGMMGAVVFGGLYAMQAFFEPAPKSPTSSRKWPSGCTGL